jgi:transposase
MSSALNPLVIASVKEVRPADGSEVRMRVDALVNGERSELEIAISTELAPLVALALLETSYEARARRDGLAPALELYLLFEKGAVLPVEVDAAAAELLKIALERELGPSPTIVQIKND